MAPSAGFLRLGARPRYYEKRTIAAKAALLNDAYRAKLPVPNGIVLLDEAWDEMQQAGIVQVDGPDVIVQSADEFLEHFALHRLQRCLALRPAFPDGKVLLDVPGDDRERLILAIVDIWQSAPAGARRDIIAMEMVTAQTEGKAFTRQAYDADLVLSTGSNQTTLPKLRRLQRSRLPHGRQRRLQLLLRGVRRSFGHRGSDWAIEWLDDGEHCWLVQLQPL